CNTEEVSPVLPVYSLLIDEPDIGFVNKCRGLKSVIETLPPQIAVGYLAQLILDKWHQLVARSLISVAPIYEQLRYLIFPRIHQLSSPQMTNYTRLKFFLPQFVKKDRVN